MPSSLYARPATGWSDRAFVLAIAANPRIRVLVIQLVVLEAHEFRKRLDRLKGREAYSIYANWMKLYVICPCR